MKMEKRSEAQLQAMWFAAGTAAFMACLERTILVSFFEQWRVLVFLALNLLLLAILFTSTRPISSSIEAAQESSGSAELEAAERKKMRKQCRQPSSIASLDSYYHHDEDGSSDQLKILKCSSKIGKIDGVEHDVKIDNEAHELSKEEFNERVETFIAMFRQHLVSDAKGQSCSLHSSHTKRRR